MIKLEREGSELNEAFFILSHRDIQLVENWEEILNRHSDVFHYYRFGK